MKAAGSSGFALQVALMTSSTLRERLCASMYSWIVAMVERKKKGSDGRRREDNQGEGKGKGAADKQQQKE